MTDETLWTMQPINVGDTQIGEMWKEKTCDGCEQKRATLCIDLFDEYDEGPDYARLCAGCLHALADTLAEFERRHKEADDA